MAGTRHRGKLQTRDRNELDSQSLAFPKQRTEPLGAEMPQIDPPSTPQIEPPGTPEIPAPDTPQIEPPGSPQVPAPEIPAPVPEFPEVPPEP